MAVSFNGPSRLSQKLSRLESRSTTIGILGSESVEHSIVELEHSSMARSIRLVELAPHA